MVNSVSGRVYSYMRFSDPRQSTGNSSERQAAYAARWAAENGLLLDESLSLRDEGLSAYHQRHIKSGALGVFLAAVEGGQIPSGSVLVVEGLDRLSRAEPIQAQAQLASIINAGITVVTASDGKAYSRAQIKANPMDLVYSLLVMIRAHEESDTKSKRVLASIRRQCEGWMAGTYRGLVRNGKDPAWLHLVAGQWQIIPDRAEAALAGLAMFRRGLGATRIVRELHARGLSLTGRGAAALQIYRMVRQHGLAGDKALLVDGQQFLLPGYYPALLSAAEWSDLQALADDRGRRRVKGDVPHVVTGLGITVCGYCGRAMVGQNNGQNDKRLPDGRMRDSQRRLHCTSHSLGAGCPGPGSCSVAPVERALMAYCSDMINLQSLYGGDRSLGPRAALASGRDKLAALDQKLERLTDAMLASADAGVPATFARRARQLEAEKLTIGAEMATAERALAAAARTDLTGADAHWRELTRGVENLDYDARLQARQLVADTFARIVVWRGGMRPGATATGGMQIMLLAKGGTARLLSIDKLGSVLAAEDVDPA